MVDGIRNLIGWLIRCLPSFRGKGRVWRHFNAIMLELGASPLVIAEMKNQTKMCVDLRSSTERSAFFEGVYDDRYIKAIVKLLNVNGVFLDVGANIGFYTVAVASFIRRKGGLGQVVAFEPVLANYKKLSQNIELNQLTQFAKSLNVGLSDKKGEALITLREDFLAGSLTGNAAIISSKEFDAGFEIGGINLEKLDDMFPNLGLKNKIDVVKVDIEGHEDFFLRGAQEILKEDRPAIFMEVNKPYYSSRQVDLDGVFLPLIPPGYKILKYKKKWLEIHSFNECDNVDNLFLIPSERMASKGCADFRS